MSSDSGSHTLDYTVFDKPSLISKGGHDTRFSYGPDRSRFKWVDDNGKGTVTTLQIGSIEKVIERSTSGAFIKSFYRRNIAGVAIERIELNASDEIAGTSTQYLHKDLQGSLDVITDSTGQVAKDAAGNKLVYSFDAWGKRRNALSWEQIAGAPANTVSALSVGAFNHLSSNRGYTGHEMLDEVGLIHMNGRVYDPTLARFVSADPLIDGVTSVQGYNRYAYVHNNPLTYTDPSGYSSWNKYRDSVVKPVVAVAIAIWTGGQSLVALQGTNYAAAVGWAAAGGAAAGAVQSGAVKGAFFGAFSAVAFMGIGNAFQGATWATKGVVGKGIMGTGLNGYGYAAKVFAHSVTGGLLSAAQGGKFKHGFAAAGVTQAFAGGVDSIDAGNVGFSAARVIAAAIVGGTASVVSGGKFANGAVTAAFASLMSSIGQDRQRKPSTSYDSAGGTESVVPEGERQAYLDKRLSEFKKIIGETEYPSSYARPNAEKLTVSYDSSYRGVAVINSRSGEITVGPRFFTALGAPVEATPAQAVFIKSLNASQYEMFVFRHELAHMHPSNIKMVNNWVDPVPSRETAPWEKDATSRAVNWARRVYAD
ncbi:RHS repeat-associated core domain-containing protein [Microbulbifer sp. VTAC004]|uniref:RHS repeat-associated core domain-containing protein n=1 Tax=Microbulbifer sp. VTAC004 TaxID=3243386 RepID=UPI004039564D